MLPIRKSRRQKRIAQKRILNERLAVLPSRSVMFCPCKILDAPQKRNPLGRQAPILLASPYSSTIQKKERRRNFLLLLLLPRSAAQTLGPLQGKTARGQVLPPEVSGLSERRVVTICSSMPTCSAILPRMGSPSPRTRRIWHPAPTLSRAQPGGEEKAKRRLRAKR